jgi:hypothetical protein
LFIVGLLALLPLGAMPGATADPVTTSTVQWATDQLSGDFAARLDLQFTQLTTCQLRVAGSGPMRAHDLVLYLGRQDNPEIAGALFLGGDTAVTLGAIGFQFDNTPNNQYWVAAVNGNVAHVPGRYAWNFAGFGLQPLGVPHPITDKSFELRVTCDRAFILHGVDAAREAFGASNVNLEQGVSFHAKLGTTAVKGSVVDGVSRTTTGPSTLVIARSLAPTGVAAGIFAHLAPDATAAVPFYNDGLSYRYSGGPGKQILQVEYAGAGNTDLYVLILGYRPVGGINGLDTWPSLPTF